MQLTNIMMKEIDKPLPNNENAESIVVGGILMDNPLVYDIMPILAPDKFNNPFLRSAIKAIYSLAIKGQTENIPINHITVAEEMKLTGQYTQGTIASLGKLMDLPLVKDLTYYVQIINKKHLQRKFGMFSARLQQMALSEEHTENELLEYAEEEIYTLRDTGGTKKTYSSLITIANQNLETLIQNKKDGKKMSGLETGLVDYDLKIGGLRKKELIITMARPSMGKSSLWLRKINGICENQPEAVCVLFSIEMSKEVCAYRFIAQEAKVDLRPYMDGELTREEWAKVAEAQAKFENYKIIIVDDSTINTMDMRHYLREIKKEHGRIDFIGADYAGLIKPLNPSGQPHVDADNKSQECKAIAKDFNVPFNLLAQVTRGGEQITQKSLIPRKPIMSDLRDGGEEPADVVETIFREDYYNMTESNKGVAEIGILKNRNGRVGWVKLAFQDTCASFENLYKGY